MFHHLVAQLLFMSSRYRSYIQTVVLFLNTRDKLPDEDDWGELKIVLEHLKGTKHMKPKLKVNSVLVVVL